MFAERAQHTAIIEKQMQIEETLANWENFIEETLKTQPNREMMQEAQITAMDVPTEH